MNDKTLVEMLDAVGTRDNPVEFYGLAGLAKERIEAQATRIEALEAALREAKGHMICADTYAERLIREHDTAYKAVQKAGLPTADLMNVQRRLKSARFNLRSALRRGRQALEKQHKPDCPLVGVPAELSSCCCFLESQP